MSDYEVLGYSFATGKARILKSNIESIYALAFLKCPSGLQIKSIAELQFAAMEMYCLGEEARRLQSDSCGGRLFNTGKSVVFGSITGKVIEGTVEADGWDKPRDISLVIREYEMERNLDMLN